MSLTLCCGPTFGGRGVGVLCGDEGMSALAAGASLISRLSDVELVADSLSGRELRRCVVWINAILDKIFGCERCSERKRGEGWFGRP